MAAPLSACTHSAHMISRISTHSALRSRVCPKHCVVCCYPPCVVAPQVFYIWVFGASATVAMCVRSLWLLASSAAKFKFPMFSTCCEFATMHACSAHACILLPFCFRRLASAAGVTATVWLPRVHWLVVLGAWAARAHVRMFVSSCLSLQYNETLSFDSMFDIMHVEEAEWIKANTPIDARIAISTHGSHFRPEMSLAGRNVMTSYVG